MMPVSSMPPIQGVNEVTVLFPEFLYRCTFRYVFPVVGEPYSGFPRQVVEIITETVRGKAVAVYFAIHQIVLVFLRLSVTGTALLFNARHTVSEPVMIPQISFEQKCRHAFEQMDQERIVSPSEAEVLIKPHEPMKCPFRQHLLQRIKR